MLRYTGISANVLEKLFFLLFWADLILQSACFLDFPHFRQYVSSTWAFQVLNAEAKLCDESEKRHPPTVEIADLILTFRLFWKRERENTPVQK